MDRTDNVNPAPAASGKTEQPASPTFEAALDELETIVGELEAGRLGLELSLQRFEQGVGLLRSCQSILETAERRIEILTGSSPDGGVRTSPFDDQATFEEPVPAPQTKLPRRRSSRPAASETESDLG